MDLTSIDRATLQGWLQEALAAMHALATGTRTVTVSNAANSVSRSVTFNQANRGDLLAWIQQLQAALGGGATRRRAIGVRF